MNQEELSKRKERAETETLVISLTDEGFKVYNPATPANSYLVSGKTEVPRCTCPDFQRHAADPEWRCKHIIAVLNQLEKAAARASKQGERESEESRGGQQENPQPEKEKKERKPRNHRNGASQMLIKRSVSPDGRIDSLSVEFSYPVEKTSPEEIKERAERTLCLQSEILERFLASNGKGNGKAKETAGTQSKADGNDGSVPAQMLSIAGMNTKRGWQLYIKFQVNGQTSKLFGKREELAKYIVAAGFQNLVDRVGDGMILNLPCRVVAKPSHDGKFLNIEKVLPIEALKPKGRDGQ